MIISYEDMRSMLEEVSTPNDADGCFTAAQCKAYLEELTINSASIMVRK